MGEPTYHLQLDTGSDPRNPQLQSWNYYQHFVLGGTRVNVPFSCDCLGGGGFLGHVFTFDTTTGVTYDVIAETYYANLTNAERLKNYNGCRAGSILGTGVVLKVPVQCSCGDESVSLDYGLFITYPLRDGESLESVAVKKNLSVDLVKRYNPTVNNNSGVGEVFSPGRDQNGNFRPLKSSKGVLTFSYGF